MNAVVVLVRHDEGPDDDRVVTFFRSRNVEPRIVRPYRGESLGEVDGSVVASVVYGGPFNVFETGRHPFLVDEHRWIEQCIARGVPLLGICQGAQSIAHTLGARCGPLPGAPHEFGYYEVMATEAGKAFFPDRLYLAESHFHEFQLPHGAERLAYSDAFPCQAMRYGDTTFAFQFHAEVTRAGFGRWQERGTYFGKPGSQTREVQDRLGAAHDGTQHAWFMAFLGRLFGDVSSAARGAAPEPGESTTPGAPAGWRDTSRQEVAAR